MKFFLFFFLSFLIAGCGSAPLDKAFNGDFSEVKNNRIIYNYCQSCHSHKELIPAPHVSETTELYQSGKFRNTKECRTCHYIKKGFWSGDLRKTIRPKREKFTKMERKSSHF